MRRRALRVAAYLASQKEKTQSKPISAPVIEAVPVIEDGADDEINPDELSDAARALIRKSLSSIKAAVATGLWDQHLDVLLVLEEDRTQGPRSGLERIVNERQKDLQEQE